VHPGDRIGPYEIVEVLAVEALATSCVARRDNATVVLRVLEVTDRDRAFVHLVLDEARLACTLAHQNVGRVYELGLDGEHAFIATEHVAGMTAGELCGRLSIPLAIAIAIDVCRGLHYLHECTMRDGRPLHIVHGEVSPPNVIVGFDGGVKLVGSRLTSALFRSRHDRDYRHLSPEQCQGRTLDRRADLYALAAVLWELTTGVPRFAPELSEMDVLVAIAKRAPVPPSDVVPHYPRELEVILLRALSHDREARHATAAELQAALAQVGDAADVAGFMRGQRLLNDSAK
jgi:serine/threonine protein kinase